MPRADKQPMFGQRTFFKAEHPGNRRGVLRWGASTRLVNSPTRDTCLLSARSRSASG